MTAVAKLSPVITIDDKVVKFKKNEFGNLATSYQTEKDTVTLKIYKYLEISGRLWFLTHLLFFIISIFGIFDVPSDKRCIVLDCSFEIKLKPQSTLSIVFNNFAESGRAIEYECDSEIKELSNHYYVDKKAKKRKKIMLITKIVLWACLIASVIAIIITQTKY